MRLHIHEIGRRGPARKSFRDGASPIEPGGRVFERELIQAPALWSGVLRAQGVPAGGAALLPEAAPAAAPDPLSTIGLAVLAYGLVQLLGKVVDRLPVGRPLPSEPRSPSGPGFTDEDRRRLERAIETVALDSEKIQRLQEAVRETHEVTRSLSEQRTRIDPRDGEPLWNCRGHAILGELETQRRIAGQALDDVREVDRKADSLLRRLRALGRAARGKRRDP